MHAIKIIFVFIIIIGSYHGIAKLTTPMVVLKKTRKLPVLKISELPLSPN